MANSQLFQSTRGKRAPAANAANEAGGRAYEREARAELALYAATGCLNGVFYASAGSQLDQALFLAGEVSPEFVAKTAIYARQRAHMKDMPALLLAHLAQRDGELMARVFERVIDNGRMLRNFVQIVRSGQVGRKSLGSRPKRAVRNWLDRATVPAVLGAAIGQQPSLADVIKMVHPKPASAERSALYAWLIGKACAADRLPAVVQEFEAFKLSAQAPLPDLPFQFLTALPLSEAHWRAIARRASWQTLRMNLNTFARHGVFSDGATVRKIAERLRDVNEIRRARVFPYQLLAAYVAAKNLPEPIVDALQDALEIATRNVPQIDGNVVVAVDVSGSMASPVTGVRAGATSVVRCVDVAALIAACIKRTNEAARIMPFDTEVRELRLNARDSVMTQARQLAGLCGGGTAVSAPLVRLNNERAKVDVMVIVSDNESWFDTNRGGRGTAAMTEWLALRRRNPAARLVCIDMQPYATSQTTATDGVLHVGGFSDAVFDLMAAVGREGTGAQRWVERIEAIEL